MNAPGAAWAHLHHQLVNVAARGFLHSSEEIAAGAEDQEESDSGTRDQHNPPHEQRLCPYHFLWCIRKSFAALCLKATQTSLAETNTNSHKMHQS